MWSPLRDGAQSRADNAVNRLTTRNIGLPAAVAEAVATLTRVRDARPAQPNPFTLRDLILAGANQSEIDAEVLARLGHAQHIAAWNEAVISAAVAVGRALWAAHDELCSELQQRAEVQIKHLETVAALDGETLATLLVDGRHSDAELLATVDVAATELDALYETYHHYVVEGGHQAMLVDGVDCTRWRDPRPVDHHGHSTAHTPTITGAFLGGLRAGGELWFPTQTEALAATEPIVRDRQAEARKLAAERASQGHLGSVMFA